ncbi:MAG TPA: hypothetical protein VFF90_12925 [Saprospiraceae bacterium]|nr:hypothetical protein [Saprospiraceae bacterium]
MLSLISEITYVGPVSSTSFKFLTTDRITVESQPEAKGRSALIEFKIGEGPVTYHGIVGVNDAGHRMLAADHVVAKPCPPFCPIKAEARAVSYP